MAKVSLRAYNREIEAMVDRGQLDEAIAHCQHILKTFPKHLETYRLLGKTYLEYKRFNEAVDILSRVLAAEPNDFVSNVGMSIIRDEQGKMDDAIWHMERAFETQPSNPAIQGELQRLYGRRDGVRPPRIRMTRGALAHMYVQGELYPQAISEIKSVLKEDPGRSDMSVLLARAYYRSGQKNQAADEAAAVLRRYPYCLEANRVMVEIAGADRTESAQAYRQRVMELDPYTPHVTGTIFETGEVGDNAVVLEHLEWDGEPVAAVQPDWGTTKSISPETGFGLGETPAADQAEPDWLKMGFGDSSPESQASTIPPMESTFVPSVTDSSSLLDFGAPGELAQPTPAEEIPEFLRAAGWGKSTGGFDESKTIFADEPASSATPAESIEQGDLPDWVKAMAPQQTTEPAASAAPPAEEEELPDWIKNIGTGALGVAASGPTEDQADWLKEPEEAAPSTSVPLPTSSEEPDWLKGLAETTPPGSSDEQLDWLTGLEQPSSAPESARSDETRIWLKGLEKPDVAQPSATEEGPDWMKELGQPAETVQPSASDNSLDWLKGIDQPAESSQPSGSDETMAWLNGLEQTETARPTPVQEGPDWLKGIDQPVESTQPAASDDTMAWLQGLDQPEAAQPTPTPAPAEDQPDWMKGFDQSSETAQTSVSDETRVWLNGLEQRESAQPSPTPVEEGPDWMQGIEQPAESAQPSAADETRAWLKGLDQTESVLPTTTPAPSEEQPDWIKSPAEPAAEGSGTTDEFDWLDGVGTEPEPAAASPSMEQPDWLTQFGSESFEPSATEKPAVPETEPKSQPASAEPPTKPRIPAVDTGSLGKSEQERDDSFAWLEALAAKQGASEGLLTKPEERLEQEPDWVKQAKGAAQPPAPVEQPPARMEETGKSQEEIDDSLAWLEGLAAKQGATEGLLTKPEERLEHEPEWVKQTRSASQPPVEQPPARAEDLGKSQQEIDDSLAWLENLAAKQGATEGLLTRPEERRQDEPDWVKQAKAATQSTPPESTSPPQPAEPAPVADLDGLGKSEQERDDSFAWLEALAAKQGASEGLLTRPEERLEEEPGWVKQARSVSQEPASTPAAATASVDDLGKSEQERDDSFAWLEALAAKQGASEGLLTKPEERLEEEPEWVKQARSAPPESAVAMPSAPTTAMEDLGKTDQERAGSFAGLEDLAAEQREIQDLLAGPEALPEPAWRPEIEAEPQQLVEPESPVEGPVASARDTETWLRSLEQEGIEPEPESDKDETAMWLKALDETTEAESARQPEASDDLPSWLSDLEKEPTEGAPTAETTEMWLKSLDEPEPRPAPAQEAPAEADVPAWLEGMDEEAKAPAPEARGEFDWLNEIEEQSASAPEAVGKEEDLPSWLRGVDEETHLPATGALRSLPGWMRDDTGEVMAEPTKIEPTRATDWQPAVEQETEQPSPGPVAADLPRPEPQPEPVTTQPPVEERPRPKPGTRKLKLPEPKPEPTPARAAAAVPPEADPMLGSARNELSRSNIPGALQSYEKLIKKGRFLEDVIFDLREALYRYPVEVSIWQALGDAYMRANRLQDALDAYTKAEELLR